MNQQSKSNKIKQNLQINLFNYFDCYLRLFFYFILCPKNKWIYLDGYKNKNYYLFVI